MSVIRDNTRVVNLAQAILRSISEVIASSLSVEFEKENFITIGCYIYRASPAIMELQETEGTTVNAKMEILQSISRKIDLAKDLVTECKERMLPVSDPELKSILSQLEGVIKDVGGDLSLIPSSAFEDQKYAIVAVRSLSQDMDNVHLEASQDQLQHTSGTESLLQPTERVQKLLEDMHNPHFEAVQSQPQKQGGIEYLPTQTEVSQSETDLYSIDVEVSIENLQFSYGKQYVDSMHSSGSMQRMPESMNRPSTSPQFNPFIEPTYEAFLCPLTKKIMDDPVTIESGVTYEREAIAEWLKNCENSEEIFCPKTGQKLFSNVINTNIALKTTIEEWRDRNEIGRIKAARATLSSASSANTILEALKDLQGICQRKQYNKVQIHSMGMLPLLTRFLGSKDRNVRCAALDLLRELADGDDDSKEMIANTIDISILIKMLSSSHQPTRHASLLVLLELSKIQSLSKRIGSTKGAILILVTNKYNSTDSFASGTANEILRNLESHPTNIKHMAENGHVEPLLNHLTEGSEEITQEMATYLGEIFLDIDSQTFVAERAASSLIEMVHSDNGLTRRAAFKALAQISSFHPNSKVLVEAGIAQIMVDEMFSRQIYDETMNSKAEAASILANIIESGLDMEKVRVTNHGHTMASDYIVYNIIHMVTNSTPSELNINLIKILLGMTKSQKSTSTIVSMFKENGASYILIELINYPNEELVVAAIKLLMTLSPYMGHTLAERLCKTQGLPENLIRIPTTANQISERMAVSAKFLAKLPHQNLMLNAAMLKKDLVPEVLQKIDQLQGSATKSSRYAVAYLEGLVGMLVRFTTTLYDPQILLFARNYNFTSVFTEMLTKTSSEEVQRLSAVGLENLSTQSVNLSKPRKKEKPKLTKFISLPKSLSFSSSRKMKKLPVCPVHRGDCSAENTFCLVEAKAVEKLVSCLESENAEVVEAALSALCTLLDDKVDVDRSVKMLSRANTVEHVLKVVKEHRGGSEGLWQKSLWMIERFLARGGDRAAICQDRVLPSALVSAFHRGDDTTRQMAERILRLLNTMPNSTSMYTTTFS